MQPSPDLAPPLGSASRRPGLLSPGAAFVILLAVLAASLGVGALLADDLPSELEPVVIRRSNELASDPDDHADHPRKLSAPQAIARFEALNALRLRAYRDRDTSLFARYLVPKSPLRDIGIEEIERMQRDGVTMRPNFVTTRLMVRRRTPSAIVIRQTVRQDPRFFSRTGRDITVPRRPKLVTVDWTLEPVGGRWRISESLIQKVKTVAQPTRKGDKG